jgi:hypothetical protein
VPQRLTLVDDDARATLVDVSLHALQTRVSEVLRVRAFVVSVRTSYDDHTPSQVKKQPMDVEASLTLGAFEIVDHFQTSGDRFAYFARTTTAVCA